MNNWKMISLIGFYLAAASATALANSSPEFPYVVSSGAAERQVVPDTASVHIELLSFHENSASASAQVGKASQAIVDVLQQHRISLDALEAGNLEKSATRARDDDHHRLRVLGYEVSRRLVIKLEDLSSYAPLMNQLTGIDGVVNVWTRFDVSNRDLVESELVQHAGANARRHAEDLARSLDSQLGAVFAVSQHERFEGAPVRFGARMHAMRSEVSAPSRRTQMVMFAPKHITLTQQVNVMFRLKSSP